LQLAWTQTWQIAVVALIVAAAARLFCWQRLPRTGRFRVGET
jgi:hypothetical protein